MHAMAKVGLHQRKRRVKRTQKTERKAEKRTEKTAAAHKRVYIGAPPRIPRCGSKEGPCGNRRPPCGRPRHRMRLPHTTQMLPRAVDSTKKKKKKKKGMHQREETRNSSKLHTYRRSNLHTHAYITDTGAEQQTSRVRQNQTTTNSTS